MQSSLSSLEKIGGVLAFLPGVSSICGIFKSYVYWGKANVGDAIYQANRIDAVASRMLKIAEERRSCYDILWKISMVEIIPFVNVIAAIFEVKVLFKLNGLHKEIPQKNGFLPLTDFDREVELFEEEITKELVEIKLKDFSEIFKVYNDNEKTRTDRIELCEDVIHCVQTLKNDAPAAQKLCLLQIIEYLSKRIDNKVQIEQLKELEFFLVDELIKEFKVYFNKITTTSTLEYERHLKIATQLLNPIEFEDNDLNGSNFGKEFNRKAGTRLQMLDFYYVETEEEIIFTRLISIYQKSIRFGFTTLEEYRPLIELYEKQLDFYKDLNISLQNAFKYQASMLHQDKLTFLEAPIPLYYNHNAHNIFLKFQEELKNSYNKIPRKYPLLLRHAASGEEVLVETQMCFLKLKSIYKTQKAQIHEQMLRCLPKKYPVYMPNLLSHAGEPSVRIDNVVDMTMLVSIYASYFDRKEDIMKELGKLITNKIMTLSLLKNPF